jgi:hypothetical protein
MKILDLILKHLALPHKGAAPPPSELEALTQNQTVLNQRLAKLENDLSRAVSGYRLMLIKEYPDILPELIGGESIAGLDQSLETAQKLTARIKEQIAAKAAAERIPGGAPVRTPPDVESLDSHGKIILGLERN